MRYIPGNAQHIGSRSDQQDSFGFSDPDDDDFIRHGGFIAVLADGIGGLENGKQASQAAVRNFLQSYALKNAAEGIPEAMDRALLQANRAVVQSGQKTGKPGDVGTTLVAVALHDAGLYWSSVGDTALYLFRNGRLRLLNNSHTYANELDQQAAVGVISRENARSHPDRDALTSYLGQEPVKEIDRNLKPFPLEPGDEIVLCTDGVFKTLGDTAMAETIGGMNGNPQASCDRVIQQVLAKRQDHQDNLTILAISVETAPLPTEQRPVPDLLARGRSRLKPALALGLAAVILFAIVAWYTRRPASGQSRAISQPRSVGTTPQHSSARFVQPRPVATSNKAQTVEARTKRPGKSAKY